MNQAEINYKPSEKQNEFHGSNANETLLIGGRGSGKTYAGVMEGYNLSIEYPGNVGLITRKHYSDLIDTTIKSFKKLIPAQCYEINENKHTILIKTGIIHPHPMDSLIYYRGLDNTELINKSRGLETGWQLWDQAEECTQDDIDEALPCQRHKLPDGRSPYYRVMYLANPTRSYIVTRFTQHLDETMKLIQISTFDNPYRTDGYVDMLQRLYKDRPEQYKAMVLGSIDIADEPDVVIPYSKIESAMRRVNKLAFFDKKIVSLDIAREGDDKTVIYGWHGCKIVDEECYGKKDLDVTAARAVAMQRRVGANTIIWDADGIGGGLMSNIRHIVTPGTTLIEFHGSSTKDVNEKYFNKRAEAWFETAEVFNNDLPSIPEDSVLKNDLATVHYEYRLGKMIVQDKATIKKNTKKSPDKGDALVYGIYGLKRAPSTYISQPVGKGTMGELIEEFETLDDGENIDYNQVIGNHSSDKW